MLSPQAVTPVEPIGSLPLTGRQLQVLALVAQGEPDKRIARELGISRQTVKNHLVVVRQHLGAQDRAHAAAIGIAAGLQAECLQRGKPHVTLTSAGAVWLEVHRAARLAGFSDKVAQRVAFRAFDRVTFECMQEVPA